MVNVWDFGRVGKSKVDASRQRARMADKEGQKTGGRVKGVPNKSTQDLHEIAERLGVNPFEILLHYANGNAEALGLSCGSTLSDMLADQLDGEDLERVKELEAKLTNPISAELRQKSAKDACEYLFAKRKAIEHTGKDGEKLFSYEEYLKTLESK